MGDDNSEEVNIIQVKEAWYKRVLQFFSNLHGAFLKVTGTIITLASIGISVPYINASNAVDENQSTYQESVNKMLLVLSEDLISKRESEANLEGAKIVAQAKESAAKIIAEAKIQSAKMQTANEKISNKASTALIRKAQNEARKIIKSSQVEGELLIKEAKDIQSAQPQSIKRNYEGWIYIGRFMDGKWNNATINTQNEFNNHPAHTKDVIQINVAVNIREDKPKFPFYSLAPKLQQEMIPVGTRLIIVEIDNKVGPNNYSWAKVTTQI